MIKKKAKIFHHVTAALGTQQVPEKLKNSSLFVCLENFKIRDKRRM